MPNNKIERTRFTQWDRDHFPDCVNDQYIETERHPLGFFTYYGYREVVKTDSTGWYFK
jgi:hypothetical protein